MNKNKCCAELVSFFFLPYCDDDQALSENFTVHVSSKLCTGVPLGS